jgi:Outer membrane protein beta-barrel domain
MTQLSKVKDEVVALHQEKTEWSASKKADISGENKSPNNSQSIVIQHDTVTKIVYIEVPQKSNATEQLAQEKRGAKQANSNRFEDVEGSNSSLNERNEVIGLTPKKQGTTPSKMNLATKNTGLNARLNAEKIALNAVENTTKIGEQKEQIANSKENKKELNKTDLIKENLIDVNKNVDNSLVINKENAGNLLDNNKINSTELSNKENTLNSTDIKKENTVLNTLPNADLATVKSISRAKNWLNDETFDFILTAKPVIIKPKTERNGWEITVNSLVLATEEHRKPRGPGNGGGSGSGGSGNGNGDNDGQRMSVGANIRMGYNVNNHLRLTAEADIWKERHAKDTMGRPQILPQDFKLATVEQTFRGFQLRIGADYKTRQIFGLQPFVGIGLAFQKRSDDDFQFRYKKDGKSLPPISVPNDAKFEKPVFISLRAGIEGKIYNRLSWSVDINAQRGAVNRQVFMSHLGVKYAF